MAMTRTYVFNVLFCDKDAHGRPKIRPWAWERG